MTNSDKDVDPEVLAAIRANPQYRDVLLAVEARKHMVRQMTEHARAMRLDATEPFVSRHYDWFYRYYTGLIARGYLMNRTGAKLRQFGVN